MKLRIFFRSLLTLVLTGLANAFPVVEQSPIEYPPSRFTVRVWNGKRYEVVYSFDVERFEDRRLPMSISMMACYYGRIKEGRFPVQFYQGETLKVSCEANTGLGAWRLIVSRLIERGLDELRLTADYDY